jgi:hypothetical protein
VTPDLLGPLLAAALSLGLWVVLIDEEDEAVAAPPLETMLLL